MSKQTIMVSAVAVVILLLIAVAGCGTRRLGRLLAPPPHEIPAADSGAVLPGVGDLDALIPVARSVSEDGSVTSQGWDAYLNDSTGTNGGSGFNVESEGTALTLRSYGKGEYAYAVYGQGVGVEPKPLQTLIDGSPCAYGGGRDEEIPLSFFVGVADYSMGSWRWFGPFGESDVLVQVNSESLKSRFKSPSDNFYMCVLAINGGKTSSSLPPDGYLASFPFETGLRGASAAEDPGGLTVNSITTYLQLDLQTEPAMVTGLASSTDAGYVTLTWNSNPDPDIDIYQVFRADADTPAEREHIASVFAPRTTLNDYANDPLYPTFNWTIGVPGKEYIYSVRAHNLAGYGGYSSANGIRTMSAPSVTASDGAYGAYVRVMWAEVEGATGYKILRADTEAGTPAELGTAVAGATEYQDTTGVLEQTYYYWVQALGEDVDSPLGGPDSGFRYNLLPVQASATDGAYPDKVEILWGAEASAEEYIVYRGVDASDASPENLGTVPSTQLDFTDSNVEWNTPHWYSIAPVIGGVEQSRGAGDFGHRGLAQPSGVSATAGTYADKVVLHWNAVNHATRYRVYRGDILLDPSPDYLGEVTAPATDYEDSAPGWGTYEGTHYFYIVYALYSGPDAETSAKSPDVEGWRGIATPGYTLAGDGTSTTGILVSWGGVSQAGQYKVYRASPPGGTLALLATVDAPATSYSDNAVAHETLYEYRVSAANGSEEGTKSMSDNGYRGLAPPLNVKATDRAYLDKIVITWSAVEGAAIYQVLRGDTQSGTFSWINSSGTTSYSDSGLAQESTYWYKVVAENSLAASQASSAAKGVAGARSWHLTIVDDVNAGTTSSIAIDSNDRPHISYRASNSQELWYAYFEDPGWNTTLVDTNGNTGGWPSLKLDNNDLPHISYTLISGLSTPDNLLYTYYDGSQWHTETVDSTGNVGSYSSLQLASNGDPCISYYAEMSKLKYARKTGASWNIMTAATDAYAGTTSLALGADGNPRIAYLGGIGPHTRYAYYDTTWHVEDVEPDWSLGCSLALDPSGVPYVVVCDNQDGNLWLAHQGTPFWSRELIAGGGKGALYCSLAINPSGYRAISYFDATDKDLNCALWNGTSWDWEEPDWIYDTGYYTSVALDSQDRPYISFLNYQYGTIRCVAYY